MNLSKITIVCLIGAFTLGLSGCIPVLVGAGVVTGYTLSNDSAIGNVKAEYRSLWDICLEELQRMDSEIVESRESSGIIRANISENNVTLKIDTISQQMQRLKISARKYLLPKPQFAQKVFLKIVENLQ